MAEASPPTLSVIIPTVSRETLTRTLESIAAQELIPGDEVLIVQDGPADPAVREPIRAAGWPWKYLATGKRANDFGSAPRNLGMEHARGDYLAFMDDDDMYRTGDTSPSFYRHDGPGAFAAIRRAIARHPGRPLLFRMERPGWGATVWRPMAVRFGEACTPMFITPNRPELLGEWGRHRGSDFAFITTTLRLWPPGALVWEPDIIATVSQASGPKAEEIPVKRNLIFHVWPLASNEEWRLNVEELAGYWSAFNGRKIVGVVEDGQTVDFTEVQRAFPTDPSIEWLVAENDPGRGESVTFATAAQMLESLNPDEATFYAHTKGVTQTYQRQPQRLESIRRWRSFMYRGCLGDPATVDDVIRLYAVAGCLRQEHERQEPDRPPSYWMFSGAFWWFNHARFYSHPDALRLGPTRHAVERHFGELFGPEEAFCFGRTREGHAYDWSPETWDTLEKPEPCQQ